MRRDCTTCDPGLLASPTAFFEELDRRRLLVPGPDLVVVTLSESGEVLGAAELQPDLESDYMGEGIAEAAQSAGAGQRDLAPGPRAKAQHLVRRRLGRTVPRPHDMEGWTSWMNSNSWTDAYLGEWYLVTQHGWRSLLTHSGPAGATPRLRVLGLVTERDRSPLP